MANEYFKELASYEEVLKKAVYFNVTVFTVDGNSVMSTNMPLVQDYKSLFKVYEAIEDVETNQAFFVWTKIGTATTLVNIPANQIKKIAVSFVIGKS